MAKRFATVMRRVRVTSVPFPAETMRVIGENVLAKIRTRLSQAVDVNDLPAPALAKSYAKFKSKRYPPPIRNWRLTGQTLGHLKVKSAGPNDVVIGFLPGIRSGRKDRVPIEVVVRKNQRRSRQWGLSPSDKQVLAQAVEGIPYIQVSKTA